MRTFVAVMNIPSPYRLHLLGEMARQLEARGIAFHCHFMAKGHADRPKSWLNPKIDFPHTYWRDYGIGQHHFNPGLILRMLTHRCDWMICGSSFDTFTGIAIQLFGRAKVKLSWLEGNTKTPGQLGGLKGWIKRLVLGQCKWVAVPGKEGAGYVALHQARSKRRMPTPVYLPNLVDETRFGNVADAKDAQLRQKLFGVGPDERVCLIPARFDPVKGLKEFFRALEPAMVGGWRLVIMGHGPEEEATMAIVRERGLSDYVKVIHSVPYDEMPAYYAAADLMLLPSVQDMNPLCVVEALHSALPIALSDQAGNVEEAVAEGRNGWVLPVLDNERYAAKLREVFSTSVARLHVMGHLSHEENARFWNTREAVRQFLDGTLVI